MSGFDKLIDRTNKLTEIMDKVELPEAIKQVGLTSALLGASDDAIIRNMGTMASIIETEQTEKANPQSKIAKGYNRTEKRLVRMLTESTGAALCDSGGAYGRNWEWNRKIADFRLLPEIKIEISHYSDNYEIMAIVSVFHFLASQLEYDEKSKAITASLSRFEKLDEQKDNGWLEVCHDFLKNQAEKNHPDMWVGDWINTYNGESSLSQVLQYLPFSLSGNEYWFEAGDSYLLLQIHQGCDVRGGYTKPVCFRISGESFLNDSDLDRRCLCGSQYSDDYGSNWYDSEKSESELKSPTVNWQYIKKTDINETALSDHSRQNLKDYQRSKYVQICQKCKEIVSYSCMAIY